MNKIGLESILKLVDPARLPWKAIHVAGTNGKGSVCAYASSLLNAASVPSARFTSPHLIDRWDGITVNEKTVDEQLFRRAEDEISWRDRKMDIGASPFELLTATAFEIFSREQVEVAVVETGLGGRLDATNILVDPLVTVITSIGLDHQDFLGETIEEIAASEAGILRSGLPCVVDGTNPSNVMAVLKKRASDIGVSSFRTIGNLLDAPAVVEQLPPHQKINIACAAAATDVTFETLGLKAQSSQLLSKLTLSGLPGRLEEISIQPLTGRAKPVLLDGAHNFQSAEKLAARVNAVRDAHGPTVTWLLAASQGKDIAGMFSLLVRDGDQVVTTRFGPVDGMPWVAPASQQKLRDALPQSTVEHVDDVGEALSLASSKAGEMPLVIAGSLYLVGDVLRILRDCRR